MALLGPGLPSYMGRLTGDTLHEAMEVGDGFATFDCEDEQVLLDVAHEYGVVMPHRDADDRGITHLRDIPERGMERGAGLTKADLLPHTDRPAIEQPPRVLLLWCSRASEDGGDAIVMRGSDVVRHLRETDRAALDALCRPDAAIFRTGADEFVGPIFRMEAGELREVRLRFDPSVHFYVDAARALPSLDRSLEAAAQAFSLVPGKGYALRNDLWLHGRRAYAGDRQTSRIMIATARARDVVGAISPNL